MPLVVVSLRSLAITSPRPSHRHRYDAPDLAVAAAPIRIARIERAVARERHVVRLVESIGMEIGRADCHARQEAGRCCGSCSRRRTCGGRGRNGSTPRCCPAASAANGSERVAPAASLADRALAQVVDHIEIAGRIDRRPFDAEGVLAGWRELPALEQGFGCGRRRREKRNAENREDGSLVIAPQSLLSASEFWRRTDRASSTTPDSPVRSRSIAGRRPA